MTAQTPAQTPAQIAAHVTTRDEALAVISDLRARFDLAGPDFTPDDAQYAADDAVTKADVDERTAAALRRARGEVGRNVTWSYAYRKMHDVLGEHGNQALADAASDIVRALAPDSGGDSTPFVMTPYGEDGQPVEAETFGSLADALDRGDEVLARGVLAGGGAVAGFKVAVSSQMGDEVELDFPVG